MLNYETNFDYFTASNDWQYWQCGNCGAFVQNNTTHNCPGSFGGFETWPPVYINPIDPIVELNLKLDEILKLLKNKA